MKGQFFHNSFLESYRNPLGAREVGDNILLYFKANSFLKTTVNLCVYLEDSCTRSSMQKSDSGMYYINLTMPEKACVLWYNFEIQCGNETLYYCPKDKLSGGAGELRCDNSNRYQITVCAADFKTPDSFKGALMYQIFPDRFAKSENISSHAHPSSKPALIDRMEYIHKNWQEEVKYSPYEGESFYTPNDYYCGNLKGIEDKIDYIANLGAEIIYLNPVFLADSNHRYNTADYMTIDPILGSNEDFSRLCKKAKDKGIRIILDGVFSHTGSNSIYFKDALNGPDSKFYSWYKFISFPNEYSCWWGFNSLPEVNEHDAGWQDFIIDNENSVIKYWLDMGAAGYRLDVADELPDDVIEKMRRAVKSKSAENILLGEVWEDATTKSAYGEHRTYALGRGLDCVMNYPFRNAVIDFLTKKSTAKDISCFLATQQQNYHIEMYYCLMNLLSSHDVARMRTVLALGDEKEELSRNEQASVLISEKQDNHAKKLMRLAIAIMMSIPGIPSIYYGDECGMHGLRDPFNRRPFMIRDNELLAYYQKWGNIRKSDVFKRGDFFSEAIDDDVLYICRTSIDGIDAFKNRAKENTVITLINRSNEAKIICIDLQKIKYGISFNRIDSMYKRGYTSALSEFTGNSYKIKDGLLEIKAAPYNSDCLFLK